jgi:[acyl-carrier-protein] S-malonyltransferase
MSSKNIAFMFPGQGAQYAGMGRDLAETYPSAAKVFAEADRALGFAISKLCFEGPEDELKLTANTQPAVLTMSVAVHSVLAEKGIVPDFVAGHSLGEYSALVASGALGFSDAVATVRLRGQYMQEAVPVGEGAMAAILGLDAESVLRVCEQAARGQVVAPANFNSPVQTVIAGHRTAVERAVAAAKDAGAKRAIPLPVSAPFHSSLMVPAEERLTPDLEALSFSDLNVPLVTNVDARVVRTSDEARDALKRQPSRPVRWAETVRLLLDSGVDTFVEVGPGKALIGMVRSIEKSVTMLNAGDASSLDQVLAALR